MPKKRACSRCSKPNAVPPSRLCPTCKRESRKKSQEKARNTRAQKVYGLNDGDYKKLYDAAPHGVGSCYICGGRGGGKLAIDHDHATGEVRGLLCTTCNYHLLGRIAKDDVDRLEFILGNAIRYLEEPPSRNIL